MTKYPCPKCGTELLEDTEMEFGGVPLMVCSACGGKWSRFQLLMKRKREDAEAIALAKIFTLKPQELR